MSRAFGVETIDLDLPALAGGFGRRLHEAGVPVGAERSARFARALTLVAPVARRRLYWTARAVFISDLTQVRAFDTVFAAVFGAGGTSPPPAQDTRMLDEPAGAEPERPAADATDVPGADRAADPRAPDSSSARDPDGGPPDERPVLVPTLASEAELLREKRFDALDADELAGLYRLMSELTLATPRRRTRRAESFRRGDRIDLRRTLRCSLRTGGDPIRLARRRRRVLPRRLVLLCDISGSMEPYARAYLQFLTCAAGAGPGNEAFAFATRLTRLTRALRSRNPERAIQHAAATAPDWSSGTRIGDALKSFNDRHGRRGMARGAVVVILSDGWERGDPGLVGREMERLSRLAYRIVWVNPRASAAGFSPQAGGMAAALPHCDALVSGHSLGALHEVVTAIGADRRRDAAPGADWRPRSLPGVGDDEPEPWASATPVPGSSVAMPSGYGPSRGRTTPGWGGG
ncbi:MAG: VWA domain-containing protein [Actinomycetota bacterium]|nr:VWA domain-containing protein [Actinomycetota bacterium]